MVGGVSLPVGLFWIAWYALRAPAVVLCLTPVFHQDHVPIHSLDCPHSRRYSVRPCYSPYPTVFNSLHDGRLHYLFRQRARVDGRFEIHIRDSVPIIQSTNVFRPRRSMGVRCFCILSSGLHASPILVLGAFYTHRRR